MILQEKHEYLPGDTIGIIPKNDATEVEQLLSRLNVLHVADYECNLSISGKTTKKNPSLPKHIPTVRSLRTIFLNDIDLRSPPKKVKYMVTITIIIIYIFYLLVIFKSSIKIYI